MIGALKRTYGGGYRAGRCGAHSTSNPYRMIKALAWGEGWHKGMVDGLNAWIKNRPESYRPVKKKVEIVADPKVLAYQIAALTHVVYHHECSREDARHLGSLLNMLEGIQSQAFPLSVTHYTA